MLSVGGFADISLKNTNLETLVDTEKTKKITKIHTKTTRFWKAFAKGVCTLVYFFKKNIHFVLIMKCECRKKHEN